MLVPPSKPRQIMANLYTYIAPPVQTGTTFLHWHVFANRSCVLSIGTLTSNVLGQWLMGILFRQMPIPYLKPFGIDAKSQLRTAKGNQNQLDQREGQQLRRKLLFVARQELPSGTISKAFRLVLDDHNLVICCPRPWEKLVLRVHHPHLLTLLIASASAGFKLYKCHRKIVEEWFPGMRKGNHFSFVPLGRTD